MNQLNFSPISEKEEESIDAFSFLQQQHSKTYQKSHQHKIKLKPNFIEAATRMFLRFERTMNNRKSYGFQLLKQFILFSSEEETIEVPYKYSQYELDGAFKILQNTLRLKIQKTYLDAFEHLELFAHKKKIYSNLKNISTLTKITNKLNKRINEHSIKLSFAFIKNFAPQEIFISNKNNQYKDKMNQESLNYNLKLHTLASLKKDKHNNAEKELTRKNKLKYNIIQTPSPLLSEKLETIMHEREEEFETNQWKDDVHLFEEDHSHEEYEQERIGIKSSRKHEKEFLESTRHKNSTFMRTEGRENKCFTLATPARNREEFEDAFETKRRKNSDKKQDDEGVQNVIVIRSSKKSKREPDRYIRVPIISEQVKIIELIPESSKRNTQIQRLETTSSRKRSHHSHSSKKPRNSNEAHKYYEEEYEQTKLHSSRHDERKYKMKTREDRDEWDHHDNECFGCKYCQVIKDMESFRLQRTQQIIKIHNFI